MGSMKENNGRGARRKLMRRVGTVLGGFAVLIFCLRMLGFGHRSNKKGLRKSEQHKNRHSDSYDNAKPFERIDSKTALKKILNAEFHLVDLDFDMHQMRNAPEHGYAGVSGFFCELDWSVHKTDPSSAPMFRDIEHHSRSCQMQKFRFDLSKTVHMVKQHDERIRARQANSKDDDDDDTIVSKVLNLTGVAFHESRCGSTLVANTFAGMDPKKHRVYSESAPPIKVMNFVHGTCAPHCSDTQIMRLFQDVVYLMSRTNDPNEERVFFKFQSSTTYHISDFVRSFPKVPWLFVYRDPVQVLMSHAKDGLREAVCTRSRKQPPQRLLEVLDRRGILNFKKASLENYCAAHLAGIVEAATEALDTPGSMGIPVNYNDLPQRLYEQILPNQMGVTITEEMVERIRHVTSFYAKGRKGRAGIFSSDNQAKEDAATPAIERAAELFLEDSFLFLDNYGK